MVKITAIEPFLLGGESTSAKWAALLLLVKVSTSNGLVGWGETVLALRAEAMERMVSNLAGLFIGRDPFEVESNRAEWYKQDFNSSISLESSSVMSAIDIACWDIMGKSLGVPVHRLLGGKAREKILVYANGWYQNCVTPDDFAEAAKKVISKGYKAMKFDPFGSHFNRITKEGLQISEERVKAIRDVVGANVDLLIEHHGRFNCSSAVRIAKMLEKYDPLFVEEPTHPENIEGLERYRNSTDLKVALGERIINKSYALMFLKKGLMDFFQIDLYRVGGITEGKKLSGLAEAFDIDMAFHNAHGPILNAASLQLDATIPNFLIQECFYDWFPTWKRNLIKNGTPVENGFVMLPDRPGLGVDLNEEIIEDNQFKGGEEISRDEPIWVVKGTWKD